MAPEPNKFLFDVNNFDSGINFDPENPPAPTFSEEEVEAARKAGFAEGMKQGLADAATSREQKIAELVARLGTDISILLNAEKTREKRFETELLAMVQSLFTRIFPILNASYGQTQIATTIGDILQNLGEHSGVMIELSPNDLEELTIQLRPLLIQHTGSVSILPQSDIEPGSFRLRWKDGGALRDTRALAEKITDELGRTLAQSNQNRQTDQ